MAAHSKISPSAIARVLACPRSVRLSEDIADKHSEYAAEGTSAHSCCETKLHKVLGIKDDTDITKLPYFNGEMDECSSDYANYVLELADEAKINCKDPLVLIEQRVDLNRYIPEGFGTADAVVAADGTLHIVDMKYGMLPVSAGDGENGNPQLLCYALGCLDLFDCLYDIKEVELHIFQPRRDNFSNWKTTAENVRKWGEEVLKPAVASALSGDAEWNAGEHCRFCKAKAICRKRAEYNLMLCKMDFAEPDTLSETEISVVLDKADQLVSWVEDVSEYALSSALSGKVFPGYKVVEGRSNRKYTDEAAVAQAVLDAGSNPYEQKLLGITAMTSLLGRKKFNDLLGNLIIKPTGKPTLVPESDKRPAFNSVKEDFKEEP